MWDLSSWPGIEPVSSASEGWFLTKGPPGKSLAASFLSCFLVSPDQMKPMQSKWKFCLITYLSGAITYYVYSGLAKVAVYHVLQPCILGVAPSSLQWWSPFCRLTPSNHKLTPCLWGLLWCVCVPDQLRLTLCDPVDCSPSGSSVHEILQARILQWVAISFSRESSHPRNRTFISCIGRWILYH